MSNISDLDQFMPEISAITHDQMRTLCMPAGIYLQEAEDLVQENIDFALLVL
jgi:hypothetical protein